MKKERTNQKNINNELSQPSFVKLAMKNMVRKGSKSIQHFGLTAIFLLGLILLIAWIGRPTLPT